MTPFALHFKTLSTTPDRKRVTYFADWNDRRIHVYWDRETNIVTTTVESNNDLRIEQVIVLTLAAHSTLPDFFKALYQELVEVKQ